MAAEEDKTVHVGGQSLPFWQQRFFRVGLLIVIVLVLVAGGTFGYLKYREAQNNDKAKTANLTKKAYDALDQQTTKDPDAAIKTLREAEKTATTKEEKVQVYAGLSSAYQQKGDYKQAISMLEKRNEVEPALADSEAYDLAVLYERAGDKAKAVEYYRKALEAVKKADAANPDGAIDGEAQMQSIQMTIDRLEGKPVDLPI